MLGTSLSFSTRKNLYRVCVARRIVEEGREKGTEKRKRRETRVTQSICVVECVYRRGYRCRFISYSFTVYDPIPREDRLRNFRRLRAPERSPFCFLYSIIISNQPSTYSLAEYPLVITLLSQATTGRCFQ